VGCLDLLVIILFGTENPLSPSSSYLQPLPKRDAWADNCVSAFGLLHPEAANVILTHGFPSGAPDFSSWLGSVYAFHGYPCQWYDHSVQTDASSMGSRWSFERGGYFSQAPATNTVFIQVDSGPDLDLVQSDVGHGTNLLNARLGAYRQALGYSLVHTLDGHVVEINGMLTVLEDINPAFFAPQFIFNLGTSIENGLSPLKYLPPNSPHDGSGSGGTNAQACAWIPLAVPSNAVSMSFDFMLQGDGKDDTFAAALGGTNVLSLETSLIETNVTMNSGLIDVSPWAGRTVEFFLGVVGGTSTNAVLTVSGTRFYSVAPPSLQAQAAGGNLIMTWPMSAVGYALETSTNLTGTNAWAPVTNVPAIVDFQNMVTNEISAGSRFYRLKRAP